MSGSDGLRWRKSTFSGANGGGCVEVADHDGVIAVRDTKDHGRGPVHRYTPDEWRAFIAGVRNGEFDLAALIIPVGPDSARLAGDTHRKALPVPAS